MKHNKVKLVAITKPLIDGVNTAEEFIAYAARVSNPTNQMNTETAPKLIKYLINNKHWSPLEMVNVVVEIETTRDIGRQILRHKTAAFQEFSGRYADMQKMGFTTRECRLQDTKNRQNSIELEKLDEHQVLAKEWEQHQQNLLTQSKELYNWALNRGIAKEQARAVLPEGLTMSRLYMQGSLRTFYHYIELRQCNGTQKEHADIAIKIKEELRNHFPVIMSILDENNK